MEKDLYSIIPPYTFQIKTNKINWEHISNIDINSIKSISDLDALQERIQELVFCQLTKEDNNKFANANCVNLFKIAQLSIEYLLHMQESLESLSAEVDAEYLITQEQYIKAKNKGKLQKMNLRELKNEYINKKKILTICSEMFEDKEQHKCDICKDKHYNSYKKLEEHYTKHHPSIKLHSKPKIAFNDSALNKEDKLKLHNMNIEENKEKVVKALKCFNEIGENRVKASSESKDKTEINIEKSPFVNKSNISNLHESIDRHSDFITEQEEMGKEGMWTSEYKAKLEEVYETNRSNLTDIIIHQRQNNPQETNSKEEPITDKEQSKDNTKEDEERENIKEEREAESNSSEENKEEPLPTQSENIRSAIVEDVN